MEQHHGLSHPNFPPGWGPLGLSRGAVGWMKTCRDEGSPLLLREACAALGCSCVRSPPSESSRQGFYGSGELLSGLLAGMIAFRFRWLLLPASYLSQEREISLQLGGGVRAAPGCWQRGALGWRLSRFGKGRAAPTSGQGQWVTDPHLQTPDLQFSASFMLHR